MMSGPPPTLDAIARDPGRAGTLSAEVRSALILQAAAVLAALGAGMVPPSEDTMPDRLLTVKEAADRLHLSTDYLYRPAKDFVCCVRPNGGRAVRFSERGLARYLRQQQATENRT
jgi:Helix-turn-helix domain